MEVAAAAERDRCGILILIDLWALSDAERGDFEVLGCQMSQSGQLLISDKD
jgi:hypothetical protein